MVERRRPIEADIPQLEGLRIKLQTGERCCGDITVVRAASRDAVATLLRGIASPRSKRRMTPTPTNYGLELRCTECGKHRRWLGDPEIGFFKKVMSVFPEAKTDVHVFRDSL
jgi:hypothetical protein